MALTTLTQSDGVGLQIQRLADVVTPAGQLSTNAEVVVAGSAVDASCFETVSFTFSSATNSIDYTVYGSNDSAFAAEDLVQAAVTVAAGAGDGYAVTPAPYRYYRVKIVSTVADTHGTATVRGVAK
jgi:hypothetical protein